MRALGFVCPLLLALAALTGCSATSDDPKPPADAAPAEVAEGPDGKDADPGADALLTDDADAAPTCVPECVVEGCGQPDPVCDQVCPSCPSDVSCAECLLRLELLTLDVTKQEATVALIFAPNPETPAPHLADLRLKVTGETRLLSVVAGTPLTDADKTLQSDLDPAPLPDGGTLYRFPVLSTGHLNPIGGGTWLTLVFRLGAPFEPWLEPFTIELHRNGQDPLLTPPTAEAATSDPRATDPVAIWPPS